MGNRIFQSIIHQLKNAIDKVCGVIDETGTVIACSELQLIGTVRSDVIGKIDSSDDIIVIDGFTYKPFGSPAMLDYIVFVEGDDDLSEKFTRLLAISLSGLRNYYEEKFDKNNFVKNIIFDNVMPGDIYIKARELLLQPDASRVVLLVRSSTDSDVSAFDLLQTLFPDKNKDFVVNINDTDVAVVKEVKPNLTGKDIDKIGKMIIDTFSTEYYSKCFIGVGSIVSDIKELARSYQESQIALEVGKVFESERHIINYDNLGIGRLIYQLPTTLCEMFMNEVFKNGSIYMLDSETMLTIQKFFENNLNVSETARKLFVHRNTLVYRLEKIKKLTGLDIREFDNAITFKVAIMVNRYLTNNPSKF